MGDGASEIREEATKNPNMSEDLLALLLKAGATGNLQDVDEKQLPELLTISERHYLLELGPYGRMLVATHPGTPPDQLCILAGDENGAVRGQVAYNPSVPPEATHTPYGS